MTRRCSQGVHAYRAPGQKLLLCRFWQSASGFWSDWRGDLSAVLTQSRSQAVGETLRARQCGRSRALTSKPNKIAYGPKIPRPQQRLPGCRRSRSYIARMGKYPTSIPVSPFSKYVASKYLCAATYRQNFFGSQWPQAEWLRDQDRAG